ncbi:10432_t:CDS:2 [Cetraspora pellucida]|uniref:10432_t:CDS:1 n=1 Tax=Cetraspora pellucida TaxID=1433469 RepID=A0A9N9GSN5_9GLOM|nr:10432_t:CDS:2 [Cetraspora pellucida]
MPKVNDEFKSLEALESAANLAAKVNRFAFSRKDSNLTRHEDEVATLSQHHTINLTQKCLIIQLHDSNTPTCIIIAAANKDVGDRIIHPKDIINEHACIRFALNDAVKGYLTLFFHTKLAKCVAKCPEVLIVDAIYKTNIYKYPLVSTIGINNICNKKVVLASYQIAMSWIKDETEMKKKFQLLNAVKKAAEKAHDPKKAISYI